MLVRLEIENFKSFKDRTILDFESTNYKILQHKNVSDNGILKGAIFVGGNATGKTNIILAMRVLLDLLFREKTISLSQYKCLFSNSSIVKLDYKFLIDDNQISYKIEYDIVNKILMERLNLNGEDIIERIGTSGKSQITEVDTFTDLNNTTLLLRTIYFNTKFYGNDVLQKWFKFLNNSVYLDASFREMFNPSNEWKISTYLENNGTDAINEFFTKYNFEYQVEHTDVARGNITQFDTDGEKDIFFKRNEIGEPIPMVMESLGNKNLLNMLPSFFQVINNGGMLIIDEFSSAFHNELEELLIRVFMSKSKRSQLFLVSHSTNLLSNTIFRPDQEFAVDFKGKDGSCINKFSNDRPREAQNIEKMYNSGCFGGKPEYSNGE